MGKNKLKIGEFSRLGRVTVRALRHYEEIGLLVPEIVDRDLWDDESHFPSVESLEQKILACEEELAVLKERRRMLRAVPGEPAKRNRPS